MEDAPDAAVALAINRVLATEREAAGAIESAAATLRS